MSILYTDSLDGNRKMLYKKLSMFAEDFVLAGGTAIMLQVNHRVSYDFDCFSEKPIDKILLSKAREIFGKDINVQVDSTNLLLFTTPEGVKVDFVHFPYQKLFETTKSRPIDLFDMRDLAANKAYAIGRRATWRDYVDMFFLLKEFDLKTIVEDSRKKFDGEFSEKLFLEQLVYYKDIEILPIEYIKKSYSDDEIKSFLQEMVKEYISERINIETGSNNQ